MENIMMWFTGKLELVRRIARQNARIAELRVELDIMGREFTRLSQELLQSKQTVEALDMENGFLRHEMGELQAWNDCCTRRMSESQVYAARLEYHSENEPADIDLQTEQDYIDQCVQAEVDRHDAEQELLSRARVKHPVRHNKAYKRLKAA